MRKSKMIVRTKFIDRACHWTVVICFFLVSLSGIAFSLSDAAMADANLRDAADGAYFAPVLRRSDFCRTDVHVCALCTPQHPGQEGILFPWLKNIVEVLKGNEHKVADVGQYNAGQKMMFWSIMSMIFVLLVTGVII